MAEPTRHDSVTPCGVREMQILIPGVPLRFTPGFIPSPSGLKTLSCVVAAASPRTATTPTPAPTLLSFVRVTAGVRVRVGAKAGTSLSPASRSDGHRCYRVSVSVQLAFGRTAYLPAEAGSLLRAA